MRKKSKRSGTSLFSIGKANAPVRYDLSDHSNKHITFKATVYLTTVCATESLE